MNNATGFVYLVEAVGLGVYKIGTTVDVVERLRTLQTGCPLRIRYVFAIKVAVPYKVEASLHGRFKLKRRAGEWFKLTSSDISETIATLRLLHIDLITNEKECNEEVSDEVIAVDLSEAVRRVAAFEIECPHEIDESLKAIWVFSKKHRGSIQVRDVQRKGFTALKGKTAEEIYKCMVRLHELELGQLEYGASYSSSSFLAT